jgi:single-strand DNA-binding protein
MRGINFYICAGNVGNEPQVKHTQGGLPVTSFNLAMSEKWKKDGQEGSRLEWVRVVCFSNLAEICGKYLGKGDGVLVMGKLRNREYEQEGEKKRITEVMADKVHFLTKKKERTEDGPTGFDEDVPF